MTGKHLRWLPVVILGLLLIAWGNIAPLVNALNIGGDDEFELGNAQLVERHPEMAVRLDNDQPWLHTLIIAHAFAIMGENAAIPRLLNLSLTFFLVLACWRLMGGGIAPFQKILFICYYFTSNGIPTFSTSAMLEPSALSLAVIAVASSYSESEPLPKWRGYLSGTIMGFAAFTKLTALIVIVAWMVLLWSQRKTSPLFSVVPRIVIGFLAATLIVVAVSPTFSIQALWLSHWKAHESFSAEPDSGHWLNFNDVLVDWIIFLPIVLGILCQSKRPKTSRLVTWFALTWLLTDFCVHSWHRPWWSYYSIHFQIPLAILAAQGTAWVVGQAWEAISTKSNAVFSIDFPMLNLKWSLNENASANLVGILAAIIIACLCGIELPRFLNECESICAAASQNDNTFIPFIRKYKEHANWIYVNGEDIAFFCGVSQPPELVLRTYKRIINGGLDKDKIFQTVNLYKPEILFLRIDQELLDKRFQDLIKQGEYVKVTWADNCELWVSSKLHPIPAKSPLETIKLLGL